MKAIIHTEVRCEECGGMMQYHMDSKFVKCNTLKCSQRGVEYFAPTVTLDPVIKKKAKAKAKEVKPDGGE